MIPTPQSDFITLSCPNCGGKLNITADIDRFACQFCGHEHIVRRNGGMVSLEPVMQVMKSIDANIGMVGAGVNRLGFSSEKQVAEQTIARLKEEIEALVYEVNDTDNAMAGGGVVGGIMGGLGLVVFIFTLIKGWSLWILLPSGVFAVLGLLLLIVLRKEDPAKPYREKVNEKQAEIEKLNKFIQGQG
jgi:predicted RNA-binding Zn-ribbon protein involved in translation (DUF1610 family)